VHQVSRLVDEVFTSCTTHERKAHLGFYKHVLDKTGIEPHCTVFVDDKVENVLSARSFGFHGVVFDRPAKAMRTIRNLISDPVERGREWLRKNEGCLECFMDKGIIVPENFTQFLILEMTNDR
jgi:FMN phosphatase YigB (HAD superfamily)